MFIINIFLFVYFKTFFAKSKPKLKAVSKFSSLALNIIPNGSETTFNFNCLYLSVIFLRASPLHPYEPKQLAGKPLWITGFKEDKIVH